jgi:hypothetical protein
VNANKNVNDILSEKRHPARVASKKARELSNVDYSDNEESEGMLYLLLFEG